MGGEGGWKGDTDGGFWEGEGIGVGRRGTDRSGVEWSWNYFLRCLTKYGQGGGETRHMSSPATGAEACFECLASLRVLSD